MNHQHPLLSIIGYGRGHRFKTFLASLCSVLNKIFDIAPEILIGVAIDVVIRQEQSFVSELGIESPENQLIALAVITFFIWLGESVFQFLYMILWRNLAQTVQHEFRVDAYRHIQNMDMAFFENQPSGRLTAILNDDINQLERFLNVGANDILQVLTSVIGVGTVFFIISPKIALFSFVPIPIIILGAFYFQRKAEPRYAKVRSLAGKLAAAINNNIGGIATIKSFTQEQRESGKIEKLSRDYSTANAEAIAVSSAFIPIIRMAILTGFLFAFIIGGLDTLNGTLEVGAYSVLVFLTQRLLWPFTNLAVTMDLYERGMASARRILRLLEHPIKIRDEAAAVDAQLKGQISLDKVLFRYAEDSPIAINQVSLDIQPHQTVAFVGQTGSGKSTLVKLLLRFYQPQSGQILLDGINISDIKLSDLRSQIGLVSQDIYLFNGSIYDNIRFGKPDSSEEAIHAAARLAEADTFIRQLPQGYQTSVGEAGVKLSGGQKQRISLARAILKNPTILILDEATSAVDNETEAAIQKSMAKIAQNRTVILIAHRLSTIVSADTIHVMDQGQIVESGNHQSLLDQNGIYHRLWHVQTGQVTAGSTQTVQQQ
ncbi:ABC transporter ATP-binding protein [Marinicella sp. W31]|uniref:ABC transporter ATP-binding protein n=1 Tax=Marinicella sp. W31 TaxID=3023713 RepID=UPI0037584865